MMTAEAIYEKAKQLDAYKLQEAYDFIDFLDHKRKSDFQKRLDDKRKYFPETALEPPTLKPAYTTRTLTLEEMDAAVDFEAGLRK